MGGWERVAAPAAYEKMDVLKDRRPADLLARPRPGYEGLQKSTAELIGCSDKRNDQQTDDPSLPSTLPHEEKPEGGYDGPPYRRLVPVGEGGEYPIEDRVCNRRIRKVEQRN